MAHVHVPHTEPVEGAAGIAALGDAAGVTKRVGPKTMESTSYLYASLKNA